LSPALAAGEVMVSRPDGSATSSGLAGRT